MANGDYFTPDQLREYIKPIEAIRKYIETYAQSEGLGRNHRGHPIIPLRSYGEPAFIAIRRRTTAGAPRKRSRTRCVAEFEVITGS